MAGALIRLRASSPGALGIAVLASAQLIYGATQAPFGFWGMVAAAGIYAFFAGGAVLAPSREPSTGSSRRSSGPPSTPPC